MAESPEAPAPDPHTGLRLLISAGALGLALTHLVWPHLAIDSATLVLFGIAVVPWLGSIFRSIQFPGGWRVEYRDLQRATQLASAAGLMAARTPEVAALEPAIQRTADYDLNLALAGLRIEIEKRLLALAASRGIAVRDRGIGQVLRSLNQNRVLDDHSRTAIVELTALLNAAVHGATIDPAAAIWVVDAGPRLLAGLDAVIAGS